MCLTLFLQGNMQTVKITSPKVSAPTMDLYTAAQLCALLFRQGLSKIAFQEGKKVPKRISTVYHWQKEFTVFQSVIHYATLYHKRLRSCRLSKFLIQKRSFFCFKLWSPINTQIFVTVLMVMYYMLESSKYLCIFKDTKLRTWQHF